MPGPHPWLWPRRRPNPLCQATPPSPLLFGLPFSGDAMVRILLLFSFSIFGFAFIVRVDSFSKIAFSTAVTKGSKDIIDQPTVTRGFTEAIPYMIEGSQWTLYNQRLLKMPNRI